MKEELKRICGVDLTSIDGINVMTAFTVISEIGTDMSRFQDEDHLTSWMGLSPSNDISSGKILGRGKKKVKNRVAVVLRTAATTLLESDTHLGARYRHLRRQLPTFKAAVKSMARYLAVLIYHLLTKREQSVDRGAAQFERRRTERELANLSSRACANGFKLRPIADASERRRGTAPDSKARPALEAVVCSIPAKRTASSSPQPNQSTKKQKPAREFSSQPDEVSGEAASLIRE